MKIEGRGQGKIITQAEEQMLFRIGFDSPRDRLIFAFCLYAGLRISESLSLKQSDVVSDWVLLRKENAKGKKAGRCLPISPKLQSYINDYNAPKNHELMFPGRFLDKPLTRAQADVVLKRALDKTGLVGISTHSFRRTCLTRMHRAGVSLRTIKKISGHSSLERLYLYLEVSEEELTNAVSTI